MPSSAGVTRMGREQKCLLKLYVEKTYAYLVLLMCLLLRSTPMESLTCLAMFKLLKALQVVSPAHSAAAQASLGSHATSLSLCFVEGQLLIQRCLLRSQQPDCIVRKESQQRGCCGRRRFQTQPMFWECSSVIGCLPGMEAALGSPPGEKQNSSQREFCPAFRLKTSSENVKGMRLRDTCDSRSVEKSGRGCFPGGFSAQENQESWMVSNSAVTWPR